MPVTALDEDCIGVPASFWAYLEAFYRLGAATAHVNTLPVSVGAEVYGNLVGWLQNLVGGVLKAIVTRYGGLRGYRSAVPLFLELLLGQCVMGSLWALIGLGAGLP